MVNIRLLKDHRHGGVDYSAGMCILVTPDTADWLIERRIGVVVDGVKGVRPSTSSIVLKTKGD